MQIEARTFQNATQIVASAQDVRRRLMMPANAKHAPAPARKAKKPVFIEKKPERVSDRFDQHEIDWHIWKTATPGEFIAWRARAYGCTGAEIIGRDKNRSRIVPARHAIVGEVKIRFPSLSLPAIGRLFGGRDHTTILYSLVMAGIRTSTKYERADR